MILSFYTEKKPGAGEDSEPIAEKLGDKRYLLGVFDGLGGAGAKQWSVSSDIFPADDPLSVFNGKTVTGAKLAANIIREEVLSFFKKNKTKDGESLSNNLVEQLKDGMTQVLRFHLKKLEGNNPASRLKSGMLKSFPTTMAVCYIAEDRGDFIWAGDSRGYILDADGLHQYTKDDLKSEGDALDNLNEDSPMSNYICETGFTLQKKSFSISKPSIIITATDGCFGYLPSPMHFEELLLSAMQNSSTMKDWEENLKKRIEAVSRDDATLSLVFLEWKDFDTMKLFFQKRSKTIDKITHSIEKNENNIKNEWKKYKKEYEKYDKTATSAGAEKSSDANEPPQNSEKPSAIDDGIPAVNSPQKNISLDQKKASDEEAVGKKDSSKPEREKVSAEKNKKEKIGKILRIILLTILALLITAILMTGIYFYLEYKRSR